MVKLDEIVRKTFGFVKSAWNSYLSYVDYVQERELNLKEFYQSERKTDRGADLRGLWNSF